MQEKSNGMNYAPKGKIKRVCDKGEFSIGVIGLDHGHIYGMCNGLTEAGANVSLVYDPDPGKVMQFIQAFPEGKTAKSEDEILENRDIKLVASASVPVQRGDLGCRVLDHQNDFFSDKPPFTTKEQLERAREKVKETGRRYAVYYSERVHVESSVLAERLIEEGAIGRVLQTINIASHRISLKQRPRWFFNASQYGGILTDLGCHQIEQFLYFTKAQDAQLVSSRIANYHYKSYQDFEDFGDAMLTADNGATCYLRVDWFTPDGLGAWGDGRLFVLGTEGYIELRKYIDIARNKEGDHLYLVDQKGEHYYNATGKEGFPFFGSLIRDCLEQTHSAYSQEMTFRAIELSLEAQERAIRVE